jgi:site-specific recombinase XerC
MLQNLCRMANARKTAAGTYAIDLRLPDGRRVRRRFRTLAEAEGALQLAKVERLKARIGVADLALDELIDARSALTILGQRTTLVEAARYWVDRNTGQGREKVSDLILDFVEDRELGKARPRYLDGIQNSLANFASETKDMAVADYTDRDILLWLKSHKDWSSQTFANRRREISVFFNWCVKQGKIVLNPVARIPSPKIEDAPVQILTPVQVRALLQGTRDRDRAYFAIALFAGPRAAELDRLYSEDISLDARIITIGAHQSKERLRRLVKIEDNLAAWLRPLMCELEPAMPIGRASKYDLMQRACSILGIDAWPQNACRHSFASYHLAFFKNENLTAIEMGTGVEVLKRRYRAVVTEGEAKEFWTIYP